MNKAGENPRPSLSKNPRVDKGLRPLMFNPALTTCASERMKTQRFSYFADFAARERMREAKPVKLKKVAFSHFFDTLRRGRTPAQSGMNIMNFSVYAEHSPQPAEERDVSGLRGENQHRLYRAMV